MPSVEIQPVTPTGFVKLSIRTTGKDEGRLAVEVWKTGTPPAKDELEKRDEHKLVNAKVSQDNKTVTCIVDVFLLQDPKLTIELNDAARTVTTTVVGIGEGTATYRLHDSDYKEITDFIAAADFPKDV
jgi:hypothetical protein